MVIERAIGADQPLNTALLLDVTSAALLTSGILHNAKE